ncbi:MAG: 30S ribosomal protein S16 [Bacteroidetes bacterium 4572_114]|nr:MAG: 30S ribosomal protein S16 [Bacteroidetes bacterium 4572_114]
MPTKIRLQRHGKKGRPFYHIVIADGRAPRDGRFIEKIGTYNPIEKPAEIILDFDRAVYWLQTGAQPTDTVRSILTFKGAIYKNHLLKGVKKGAFSAEQAELKFQEWMETKTAKIENASKEIENAERAETKKLMETEVKIKEDRAAELSKKRGEAIEKEVAEAQAKQVAAKEKTAAEDKKEEEAAREKAAEKVAEKTAAETTKEKSKE